MTLESTGRTAARWAKECLRILRGVHPEYERNELVRGPRAEFVRPHPSGLLISQNFIRIRGTYHLCFALLFAARPSPLLLRYVLHAGARFDDGQTIWRQLLDDMGLHRAH